MNTWVSSSSPALVPAPGDIGAARRTVAGYSATVGSQADLKRRIMQHLEIHPDALERDCMPGHLTGSVVLMDHRFERSFVLLHRKLGLWLQPGGHLDGDGNLVASALREATEESGIEGLEIWTSVLDLDIHGVDPPGERPHDHLDVRFVARAPERAAVNPSDEAITTRWATPEELVEMGADDSVTRLVTQARRLAAELGWTGTL